MLAVLYLAFLFVFAGWLSLLAYALGGPSWLYGVSMAAFGAAAFFIAFALVGFFRALLKVSRE